MEILCFFAGVAFVCLKTVYPLYLIVIVLFLRPQWAVLGWFLAAIIWAIGHQSWVAIQKMPEVDVIKNAALQGYITSIPTYNARKTQFTFLAERLDDKPIHASIILSCYEQCPLFQAGQYWSLRAKLKKPHNVSNPGGFDYVNWLGSRHVYWTGYIRHGTSQLIDTKTNPYPLLTLRQHLALTLAKINPDEVTLGILQALTLGITTHIDKTEWDLFRRTGTTHLMVISGAHIGLVAGLTYLLAKWLWCRFGLLCLWCPASKIASVASLLIAFIYALLAGFAVPAQRALVVCFFMLSRNFCSQRFSVWQAWRYALLAVLMLEPHSVMLPGFYLSFIAVAILVMCNQRLHLMGIRKMVCMQLACLFGLMPLTLFWFSYGSINGFAANLLAIPWVSFIIVPLGLLITVLSQWIVSSWMMNVQKMAINGLLTYLQWIDSFAMFNLTFSFTRVLSPLALMASMAIISFMPKRLFPAAMVLAIAGSMPAIQKVKLGEAVIDILDVGQGLAIVARTANHVLIYDTGVKFYQGGDMGKMALIPYLDTLGVHRLDKVVISHPDLDHRGGLSSLEEKYKIEELVVDDPAFYKRGLSCHQYPEWKWDGVSFHFFAITKPLKGKNNRSCVLQIVSQAGQILLSGDIEKLAENYLVNRYGSQLASSVMVVPHHGSKTSSSISFIDEVAPQYAVVSYGFDNPYHLPHKKALQVYQDRHIPVYNTLECGMISVFLGKQKNTLKPSCYRLNFGQVRSYLSKVQLYKVGSFMPAS